MSDRKGVRSSNRLTTPQPAQPSSVAQTPSSRGSRRSARHSKSANQDIERSRTQTARNTRQTRASSVESNLSSDSKASNQPRGAKRRQVKDVKDIKKELSTVIEDVPDEDEDDDHEDNEGAALTARRSTPPPRISGTSGETAVDRSPGMMSIMSGSTARTTFSRADAARLNADEMLDELDGLYTNSQRFLDHFAPKHADPDRIREMHQSLLAPGTPTAQKFGRKWRSLSPLVEVYTTPENHYILPNIVLKGLFGIERSEESWMSLKGRPDPLLYLGNLAVLTHILLPSQKEQSTSFEYLREVEVSFPTFFLSGFGQAKPGASCGVSVLHDKTFGFGLELRTQIAIQFLESKSKSNEASDDLTQILDSIFYDEEAEDTPEPKGWDMDGLGNQTELPPRFANAMQERYEVLKQLLIDAQEKAGTDDEVDFEEFDSRFPWSDFLITAIQWVRLRVDEIEGFIRLCPDVQTFEQTLRQDISNLEEGIVEPAEDEEDPRNQREAETEPSSTRRRSRKSHGAHTVVPEGIEFLKQLGNHVSSNQNEDDEIVPESSNARLPAIPTETEQSNLPDSVEEMDDEDVQMSLPMSDLVDNGDQSSSARAKSMAGRTSQSNRKGKLPVKQVLTQRERVEAQLQQQKENLPESSIAPAKSSNKRRYIDEQDGAQTVDFSDDLNSQTQPVSSRAGPSTKRKRALEDDDVSSDEGFQQDNRELDDERLRQVPKRSRTTAGPSLASRKRRPVPVVEEQEDLPSPPRRTQRTWGEPRTQAEKRMQARQNVAVNKRHANRREKNPWTVEEEDELVRLMAIHGPNWALLRDYVNGHGESPFPDRDNVDLKDKARNMKVVFIKTHDPLPAGFDRFSIGPRLQTRLAEQGFIMPEGVIW